MALSMPIPPWLVTRPAEHAEASSAGLREGLAAANIWARANEERARLEQSAKRADMEAALEQQRLQEKSVYEAQKLAADVAYNKAALGQAQAKIQNTQANAEQAVKRWQAQAAIAQQREARLAAAGKSRMEMEQGREARLAGDASERAALVQQRNAEIARHNLAMENKQKGISEDEALKAYAKTSRDTKEGPGLLDRIKGFFSPPTTAPTGETKVPFKEGSYIRNKKDKKLYVIKNGEPVLVESEGEEEPAQDEKE